MRLWLKPQISTTRDADPSLPPPSLLPTNAGNEGVESTVHPSLTDPKESISSLGSRRKRHRVGLFSIGFLRYDNFEPLLHIVVARRTIRFTLFYARLMTYILRILFFSWFLSMVIMFYTFSSFKQIWTTKYIAWSGRSRDRKRPGKKKIGCVETNYSPGMSTESKHWEEFHWVCYRGVWLLNYSGKLHTGRGGGGGRNVCEMCYVRDFSRLKRCIRGGS